MKEEIRRHIPDRIWLQYFGEDDPEMLDKPPETEMGRSDVSWCREKVFKHDIEYVRAENADARELAAGIPGFVNDFMLAKKTVIKRDGEALWVGFEPKDYEILARIVEGLREGLAVKPKDTHKSP